MVMTPLEAKGSDLDGEKELNTFGRKVQDLADGKGISLQALAEAAGLDYSGLRRSMRGSTKQRHATLKALAKVLDVDFKELTGKEQSPDEDPDVRFALRVAAAYKAIRASWENPDELPPDSTLTNLAVQAAREMWRTQTI